MGNYRGTNIVTDGLVFGYDADDRSSRFYPGEPTTNLCNNFTNIYEYWNNSGALTVNTNDTTLDKLFTGVNVFSGTVATAGQQHLGPAGCNITPNTTYTISIYLFIQGNTTFDIQPYIRPQPDNNNAGNLAYNGSTNWSTWPKNQWIRIEGTFTASATATSVYISCYIGAAVGHKIYYTAPQIEAKSHKTPFIVGSRSVTQGLIDLKKGLSIDLSNVSFDSTAHPTFDGTDGISISTTLGSRIDGQPLTVECVMKPGRLAGQYQDIIVNRGDAAWNWMLYQHTTDGAISFHAGNTQNKSTFIPTVGKWYHVVATVTGAGVCKLYINGSVVHQNNSYVYGTGQPNLLCIGKFGTSSEYYLGEIRVAKLYNKSLSDTEVLQNYSAYKYRFNIE